MCMRILVILHFFWWNPASNKHTSAPWTWNSKDNTSRGICCKLLFYFFLILKPPIVIIQEFYVSWLCFVPHPQTKHFLVLVAWRHQWCCVTKKGPSLRWLQPWTVGVSVLHLWPLYYRTRSEDKRVFFHYVVRADFLVTGSSSRLVSGCYSALLKSLSSVSVVCLPLGVPGSGSNPCWVFRERGKWGHDPVGTWPTLTLLTHFKVDVIYQHQSVLF